MTKKKPMTCKQFYKMLNEFKKDPEFMKSIEKFIEITTGEPYKLK